MGATNDAFIKQSTLFLRESNAIEGVYDEQSLSDAKLAWWWLSAPHIKSLTLSRILKVHKILMDGQEIADRYKGMTRDVDVWVGGNKGAPPHLLQKLISQWTRRANKLEDPIRDHVLFEDIHPFIDGNGRVGRILMNWQFNRMGKPLKIFTEEDRGEYYKLFH